MIRIPGRRSSDQVVNTLCCMSTRYRGAIRYVRDMTGWTCQDGDILVLRVSGCSVDIRFVIVAAMQETIRPQVTPPSVACKHAIPVPMATSATGSLTPLASICCCPGLSSATFRWHMWPGLRVFGLEVGTDRYLGNWAYWAHWANRRRVLSSNYR